jgi:hypothetical protein
VSRVKPSPLEVIMHTVEQIIAGFIIDRKAQGLSPNTIKVYTKELKSFQRFTTPELSILSG